MKKIFVSEYAAEANLRNEFILSNSQGVIASQKLPSTGMTLPFMKAAVVAFKSTFLPAGYPDSVRPQYLKYQFWDSVQGLSSYLRSVLTTKAILGM